MKLNAIALATTLLISAQVQAETATVISEEKEHIAGAALGGTTMMLIGGAVSGGPVGAIIGGLAGIFAGSKVQEQTGLSGNAYTVKYKDGSEATLRSPNHQFLVGDLVSVESNRPRPLTSLTSR